MLEKCGSRVSAFEGSNSSESENFKEKSAGKLTELALPLRRKLHLIVKEIQSFALIVRFPFHSFLRQGNLGGISGGASSLSQGGGGRKYVLRGDV